MLQVTPLLLGSLPRVAVNASVLPATTMVPSPGVTETVIAGTVMLPVSDFVLSATEVAVMLTVRSLAGVLAGALYVTEVLVVLLSVPAPVGGERLHVTPAFEESF